MADIPQGTWDDLAARTPWATPFSSWAFQRAWWDAFGDNAHEETLLVCADGPDGDEPRAIIPLMHRHQVEPSDALTHTTMRHGDPLELTRVDPAATTVFFGASYHADYATILASPADLPAVAEALADHLADTAGRHPWDVVDLRRLRCGDPTTDALATAFGAREVAEGWTLNVEREDVCPVVTLPTGTDMDGFLATLGKKERHEIRRKVRRAEAVGEIRLVDSLDPLADLEAFIELHQKRWGELGLFPDTPGGEQSRVFARRLFELHGADGPLRLTFLTVGDANDRGRHPFRDARRLPVLQRRGRPRRPRPVTRRPDDLRLRRARARGRQTPARFPAWQRALQIRVGRGRRADPARPGPSQGRLRWPR